MNKTKIPWCDYTINPVKGLCPVDCKDNEGKSYCYARRLSQKMKEAQIKKLTKPMKSQTVKDGVVHIQQEGRMLSQFSGAVLDNSRQYRFLLWRFWDEESKDGATDKGQQSLR